MGRDGKRVTKIERHLKEIHTVRERERQRQREEKDKGDKDTQRE